MGIGASIFLIALGAILAFALNLDATQFGNLIVNWEMVGFILMLAGVVGLVWTLMLLRSTAPMTRRGRIVEQNPDDDIIV